MSYAACIGLFTLYYHVNLHVYLQYVDSPIIPMPYIILIYNCNSYVFLFSSNGIILFNTGFLCMVQVAFLIYHDHGFIFGAMFIVD